MPNQVWEHCGLGVLHRHLRLFSNRSQHWQHYLRCARRAVTSYRISLANLKSREISINTSWRSSLWSDVERSWGKWNGIRGFPQRRRLYFRRRGAEQIFTLQWVWASFQSPPTLHRGVPAAFQGETINGVVSAQLHLSNGEPGFCDGDRRELWEAIQCFLGEPWELGSRDRVDDGQQGHQERVIKIFYVILIFNMLVAIWWVWWWGWNILRIYYLYARIIIISNLDWFGILAHQYRWWWWVGAILKWVEWVPKYK